MQGIRTGDGTRDNDMGPLISAAHRDKVVGYNGTAEGDSATVVVAVVTGGRRRPERLLGEPHAARRGADGVEGVPGGDPRPGAPIVRVASYEEGLELINANPFGNGTAIFANDGGAARRFQNEVQVSMVGVNVPIPVPVGYRSFGGWKQSAFGQGKAYGKHAFDFYTVRRSSRAAGSTRATAV